MTARQQDICGFCVMDRSYPDIEFDQDGQCNCCSDAIARRSQEWWPGVDGTSKLDRLVASLRERGVGRKYDAMIGLSGGVDSAYLAHLMKVKYGLRLLAVHVDAGWNSEAAVRNIELLVRKLDLDFFTHVVEWGEMRDVQVAFLKAGVINQDIPQDHAFFSTLYRTARKFNIGTFLSGVNYATECVIPPNWGYPAMDGTHVRGVHARFGNLALRSYPIMGFGEYIWMTRIRRQLTVERPLNYLDYAKESAKAELCRVYGWRDYGGKHHESRFTKFYQEVFLPRKFGFDKRRLHLSSLIVSGQITRDQALAELETPIADENQIRRDTKFVAKKLGLDVQSLVDLLDSPAVSHTSYPNQVALYKWLLWGKSILSSLKGNRSMDRR